MHAAQVPLRAQRDAVSFIAENWSLVALRGAASILFGALAIAWPDLTLLGLVWLFGIYAVLDGIFNIASGVRGVRERRRDWVLVLLGIAGIAAGVIAIVWPGITALVLIVFIGAWAVVTGALEIVAAIRMRSQGGARWLLILAGLASVMFGVLVMWFPGAGALALVLVIGSYAIASGALLLVAAYRLRALNDADHTEAATAD
jgi:uncharacterized membrane protein HdeD (DUF308 family)